MAEIIERVQSIVSEKLSVNPADVTPEKSFTNDLGADSLDLVELIMTLEDEYGISATDESVYENKTVGEIADYIETLIK